MKYFENYKTVDLDMLRESGMYSNQLLKIIEDGNHIELARRDIISKEQSQDIDFMGPIVYAFKKEHKTYIGYKYCGKNLQEKLDFATDIIEEEPEVIIDTPISADREFIVKVAIKTPEVVKHMAVDLKTDTSFISELCELNIPKVTMYAAQECKMPDTLQENPEFAENKEFMLGFIQKDSNALAYASDELKDNYEFIKEACANEKVIDYVTEHMDEFGQQGLTAVKDVVVEKSTDEAIIGFKEEKEKIKKEIEENTAKDGNELEELLKRDKQLQRHIRFFKRIQSGEIDPVRAAKLIDKMCVNLDERYRNQIKKVLKLDEAIAEKQKANEEKGSGQSAGEITPEMVEKTTTGARLPGIEEEIAVTREEIEGERNESPQPTKEEIEVDD